MRSAQIIFLSLLAIIFVGAGVLLLRSSRILWTSGVADVKPVPAGYHEVAWIGPASSAEIWERIVEAAELLRKQWSKHKAGEPKLAVDLSGSYPRLTTEVPEIVLWQKESPEQKILLRWYKLSDENTSRAWIRKLMERGKPPLAIIGGESTRRAIDISNDLKEFRDQWQGAPPIFLITTATADAYSPPKNKANQGQLTFTEPGASQLLDIYKDRNYRFSFPNSQMTRAVMDFVEENPRLWGRSSLSPRLAATIIAAGNPWMALTLEKNVDAKEDYAMYAVDWMDDNYSTDLRDRFVHEFQNRYYPAAKKQSKSEKVQEQKPMPSGFDELFQEEPIGSDRVPHMIRGDAKPNWQEISAADRFIKFAERSKRKRQILVLPTSAERAGRYLRALVSISPKAVRNVVVLSGDSISFNNIYRDRKLSWNIMEYPVPLVFFCHRNPVDPVDKHAGFRVNGTRSRPWAVTGTVDLLFYRDVLEALVVAAYAENGMVSDADKFDERLQKLRWCQERVTRNAKGTPLFAERNRNRGTGEHIVSVMPHREGGVVLPYSTITVWSRNANTDSPRRWRQVKMLPKVSYQDWEGRSDSSFDDFIVTVK